MPTVLVPAHLTIEHLMAAIKQLSPAELREFAQQFDAWQEKNSTQIDEEATLLATIEENSRLAAVEQRCYERLCWKRERRTLTESELAEYQCLLQQLEARDVRRAEALIALAQHRGTTLQGLMAELGLPSADYAK
jgi:hypothetical protein